MTRNSRFDQECVSAPRLSIAGREANLGAASQGGLLHRRLASKAEKTCPDHHKTAKSVFCLPDKYVIYYLPALAQIMTTAPHPAISNTRRSSELRQQEIIEIVLVLAAERGVEAITTTLIAERLGLTQGAVFRHFPNKKAIWTAVLFWLTGNMAEIFERRPGVPPLREIERIFDGYMDFIADYPAMPRLIFSDTFHHAYPDLHRSVRDMVAGCEMRFQDLIGEAAALGDIKPGREETAAKLLLTTIQGIAFQSAILGLVLNPRREGQQLFTLWKSALLADKQTMPVTPEDDRVRNLQPGRPTGAELTRMRLEN